MEKKYVVIDLTEKQKRELKCVVDYAKSQDMDGKPGMILGQFYDFVFKVAFIGNKKALRLQKIMNEEG